MQALVALAIGTAGGLGFFLMSMPLPWMLGALACTMAAAVAGTPVVMPDWVRTPTIAVIGVLLGSGFSPELMGRLPDWGLSLAVMILYLAVTAAISVPILRRFAGHDRMTAYFAGMPGGMAEMAEIARGMGADDRKVILAHSARIVVTIAVLALWFRLVAGYEVSGRPLGPALGDLSVADALLLAACGLVGAFAGLRLRLPAPTLFGPMLLSALVHATGITESSPPALLVIAAQVVLGTHMGCRFRGVAAGDVARALGLSLAITVLTLGLAMAFALLFHRAFGQSTEQVLLAYAPGGLTEMSLIALAMQAEVAYVSVHHMVRIVLIIAVAPLVVRLWR